MVRFWMLVAVLALGAAALFLGPLMFHQDFAGHPLVELATVFGLVFVAPVLLIAHPSTLLLFPIVATAIVILAWRRFVGKNELAGKVLFLVWIWSGFVSLGVMVATDFSGGPAYYNY